MVGPFDSPFMDSLIVQFEAFKSFYSDIAEVQSLTIEDVARAVEISKIDWNKITPADLLDPANSMLAEDEILLSAGLSKCEMACGYVVYDIISLIFGAYGLRAKVRAYTISSMAQAISPVRNEIEIIIAQIAATTATIEDKAYGVVRIVNAIYNGGSFAAVYKAFKNSLTWWQAAIYGVNGIATVVAFFSTGGMALVAEIALVLVTFGTLLIDVSNVISSCSPISHAPPPLPEAIQSTELLRPNIALKTSGGFYVSVVSNGGLGNFDHPSSTIYSDSRKVSDFEKFTIEPVDMLSKTIALKTFSQNYVAAINGGGIGSYNDSRIIRTNSKEIGPWESLVLIQQPDGTYALSTTSGYFLTATNGGGLPGNQDSMNSLSTNSTMIGTSETFNLNSIGFIPSDGAAIRLRSWKGDYLHRPDSIQGVTTFNYTALGDEWIVERENDTFKFRSWKGDYLHRPDSAKGVTTYNENVGGNEWSIETSDSAVRLRSWKGDYLHRPDSPQGVTTFGVSGGSKWIVEVIRFAPYLPESGNIICLRSWKGDYLHRPDSPQGVTTSKEGVGNNWTVEMEGDKLKLRSWKGDYLHRPNSDKGVTTYDYDAGGDYWIIEISGSAINIKSWKDDYLFRPDSSQGVSTSSTGIGKNWVVELA